MKFFSQNSLVDNKLKNKYKMFVIIKTSNKDFVFNNIYYLKHNKTS